ncbi:MAG: FtsQ-type POTRA domain-containing protein [Clostridia bacterium]|nr:FtsQ-type POTRA domain-containing protein [Clostridia bacterium]
MTAQRNDRPEWSVRAAGARTAAPHGAEVRRAPQAGRPASPARKAAPTYRDAPARNASTAHKAATARKTPPAHKATAARKASPKRRSASRRYGMAALSLLAIAALIVLGTVFTKNRQFVLGEVLVEGNQRYTDSEIAAMASLTPGESIFDISREAVERSLSAYSDVKLVDFRVTYPHTVCLTVSELQARAAVNCAGVILLVDTEGRILDRLSSVPEGSVVVSGMDVSVSARGRSIETAKDWQLGAMKDVLDGMDAQGLMKAVSEFNVADRYNLYLVSNTGVKIVLGDVENLTAKLVWARTVLEKLTEEGVRSGVLDVSTGKNAVYADR